MRVHTYAPVVTWTGNLGTGTSGYRDYGRDHRAEVTGKPAIEGSADATFHGDRTRWNPEELFVVSLAQCHMLTYLHLATTAGVVVLDYADHATGEMTQDATGAGGVFTSVTLRPQVTVAAQDQVERAIALHDDVPALCFIARSVSVPVHHEPTVRAAG